MGGNVNSPLLQHVVLGPTSAKGTANGNGKGVPLGPIKTRSTMNSRGAAYEEAIAAFRREAANGGPGSAAAGVPGMRGRRGVTESQEHAGGEEEARKGNQSTSSSA
jgi:hypothetical protein